MPGSVVPITQQVSPRSQPTPVKTQACPQTCWGVHVTPQQSAVSTQ